MASAPVSAAGLEPSSCNMPALGGLHFLMELVGIQVASPAPPEGSQETLMLLGTPF